MHSKKCSRGFSLVEVLIVVAIVGILAAVAIPAYHNHVMRSRQADAYHNLLDMKAAQEMFYSMYNEYGGPYTHATLDAGNTYSALLSFSLADSTYYTYAVSSASDTAFEAMAMGRYKKLTGNKIRIRHDEDPCMETQGALKQSLGLPDCPP